MLDDVEPVAKSITVGRRPQVISRGENWPTADNIGHLPGAFAKPADETSDLETLPPPLNNGNQIDGPYYDVPGREQLPSPNLTPTPAIQGSTTRNVIAPVVQSVSYNEPIMAAPPEAGQSSRKNNNVATPVAILKRPTKKSNQATIVRSSKPLRDESARPAKRLKAATLCQQLRQANPLRPKAAMAAQRYFDLEISNGKNWGYPGRNPTRLERPPKSKRNSHDDMEPVEQESSEKPESV